MPWTRLVTFGAKKFWKFLKSKIFEKSDVSYRKKCHEHGLSCLEWKNFENFPNRKFLKKIIYLIEKNVLNTDYHVWMEKILKISKSKIFEKITYLIEKNVLNTVYHVCMEKILKISKSKNFKKIIYLIEKNALNTVSHIWSEKILKISKSKFFEKNNLSYRKKCPENG